MYYSMLSIGVTLLAVGLFLGARCFAANDVVTEVHVVFSNHYDAGCKIGGILDLPNNPHRSSVRQINLVSGCSLYQLPGEPNTCEGGRRPCLRLMFLDFICPSHSQRSCPDEPYSYNVLNRYFDEYIPAAIDNAEAWRAQGLFSALFTCHISLDASVVRFDAGRGKLICLV